MGVRSDVLVDRLHGWPHGTDEHGPRAAPGGRQGMWPAPGRDVPAPARWPVACPGGRRGGGGPVVRLVRRRAGRAGGGGVRGVAPPAGRARGRAAGGGWPVPVGGGRSAGDAGLRGTAAAGTSGVVRDAVGCVGRGAECVCRRLGCGGIVPAAWCPEHGTTSPAMEWYPGGGIRCTDLSLRPREGDGSAGPRHGGLALPSPAAVRLLRVDATVRPSSHSEPVRVPCCWAPATMLHCVRCL